MWALDLGRSEEASANLSALYLFYVPLPPSLTPYSVLPLPLHRSQEQLSAPHARPHPPPPPFPFLLLHLSALIIALSLFPFLSLFLLFFLSYILFDTPSPTLIVAIFYDCFLDSLSFIFYHVFILVCSQSSNNFFLVPPTFQTLRECLNSRENCSEYLLAPFTRR